VANNIKRAEEYASKARADVASIEARITRARAIIEGAAARRSEFTLAAATGSAKAAAALLEIRTEVSDAEHQLIEFEEALPRAREVVLDAEVALKRLIAAERVIKLRTLVRERLVVTAEIDACVQQLGYLIAKFNELGVAALVPYADILAATGRNGTSSFEAALGAHRVADALAAIAAKLYPLALIPNKFKKLDEAERAFWATTIGTGDASA
jgi:hypothetical protein